MDSSITKWIPAEASHSRNSEGACNSDLYLGTAVTLWPDVRWPYLEILSIRDTGSWTQSLYLHITPPPPPPRLSSQTVYSQWWAGSACTLHCVRLHGDTIIRHWPKFSYVNWPVIERHFFQSMLSAANIKYANVEICYMETRRIPLIFH